MGGLGSSSNEVTTLESNATYYNVTLNNPVGGSIETSFSGNKVMEGKDAVFTAKPLSGWKFAGWSDASAAGIDATKSPATIKATGDIELAATFVGDGSNKFQAEEGVIENAINESTNAGFAGAGYVNFGTGTSYVQVPVYADGEGEYKLTLTYANGSSAARSLSIKGEVGESQEIEFATTGNWTTYVTKDVSIMLPFGASTITFATVGGNDGPNLDQLELTAVNVTIPESKDTSLVVGDIAGKMWNFAAQNAKTTLFSVHGVPVRESLGAEISTEGLPAGIYIVRTTAPGFRMQKAIRVK